MRAANVGGRIHRMNTPGGDLVPGYVMASKALLLQVIRDGSIIKVRGAGRLTINELRQYAGLKPITIKRCPHCGQMMK